MKHYMMPVPDATKEAYAERTRIAGESFSNKMPLLNCKERCVKDHFGT